MLHLKKANLADIEKEFAFVRDIPADENGFTNDYHGITREDFEHVALARMLDSDEGKNLPDGYVPETFLFLWKDDEIIGQYRVRHHLCESLRTGAGHIGCFIHSRSRGQGYGTEGLRLALEFARSLVPENEIYLRVNRGNTASLKAMLKNGGYIACEDNYKYYVRIPK